VLGGRLQDFIGANFGFSGALLTFFAVLRWVIIAAALLLAFSLIYYLAPNTEQRFKWVTPGSVLGVTALVLVSLGFRLYVQNFGAYDATYGSIGAVIILMLWLYAAGLVLLIGSEVNVVFEKHVPEGKERGQKRLPENEGVKARPPEEGAAPA
jgi:membrane protein